MDFVKIFWNERTLPSLILYRLSHIYRHTVYEDEETIFGVKEFNSIYCCYCNCHNRSWRTNKRSNCYLILNFHLNSNGTFCVELSNCENKNFPVVDMTFSMYRTIIIKYREKKIEKIPPVTLHLTFHSYMYEFAGIL